MLFGTNVSIWVLGVTSVVNSGFSRDVDISRKSILSASKGPYLEKYLTFLVPIKSYVSSILFSIQMYGGNFDFF